MGGGNGHGSIEPVHKEEERVPTDAEFALSMTIFAVVIMLITSFYFFFHRDTRVRAFTWEAFLAAVNMFLSVDLFFGIRGLLLSFVSDDHKLVCCWIIAVMFASLLQIAMWRSALYRTDRALFAGVSPRVVSCKAWGGVIAHVVGFAWISFWAEVQDKLHDSDISYGPALVVCAAYVFKHCIMAITCQVRRAVAFREAPITDEMREWLWVCEENEAVSAAVMLSFLTMQTIRYHISGHFPTVEGGVTETHIERSWDQIVGLGSIAVFAVLCATLLLRFCGPHEDHAAARREGVPDQSGSCAWWKRTSRQLVLKYLIFICGWCITFATDWWVETLIFKHHRADTISVRICTAVICSYITFLSILIMAHAAHKLGESRSRFRVNTRMGEFAFASITEGLGLMVGFSWDRTFDRAIEDCSHRVAREMSNLTLEENCHLECKLLQKTAILVIALVVFALLMPAAFYIINPLVIAHSETAFQAKLAAAAARNRELGTGSDEEEEEHGAEQEDDNLSSSSGGESGNEIQDEQEDADVTDSRATSRDPSRDRSRDPSRDPDRDPNQESVLVYVPPVPTGDMDPSPCSRFSTSSPLIHPRVCHPPLLGVI